MSCADGRFLCSQAIRRAGRPRFLIRCAVLCNGRAGDQTTCRSLIYGSKSSTATSPIFDPLGAAVQSRLARSPRPLGIECPQCVGQRPHGRAGWRSAPGTSRPSDTFQIADRRLANRGVVIGVPKNVLVRTSFEAANLSCGLRQPGRGADRPWPGELSCPRLDTCVGVATLPESDGMPIYPIKA